MASSAWRLRLTGVPPFMKSPPDSCPIASRIENFRLDRISRSISALLSPESGFCFSLMSLSARSGALYGRKNHDEWPHRTWRRIAAGTPGLGASATPCGSANPQLPAALRAERVRDGVRLFANLGQWRPSDVHVPALRNERHLALAHQG